MKHLCRILKNGLVTIVLLCAFLSVNGQNTVGPFTYYPTNVGGTMQGQAQIGGVAAASGDIIAAFDPSNECVGAAALIINSGIAYISFVIYGDDGGGHGMSAGESFTLKLYDASSATTITYSTPLTGWTNTNFAPMPGFNNPSTVYNFVTNSQAVSPASRDVTSSAGTTTFDVTSTTSWTVSESVSWLTVSPMSGSNNGTLTVNYTANTGTARSGQITVSATGLPSVTVTVNQAAPASYLTVTPSNRDVTSSSGSTTFSVSSNTTWTVSDNVSWLAASPASGSNNGTITATYSSNAGAQRVATITVTGLGVTPATTVTVTQAAPVVTKTITISSENPASGVPITVSPADNSGNASGTTEFTRTYNNATNVTLTAPASASGNVFQKWLKNSADYATTMAITFSATASDTYTAVFVAPSSVSVSFPDTTVMAGASLSLPIYVSNVTGLNIISCQFTFTFDESVIEPVDPYIETTGSVCGSASWSVMANPNTPGQLIIGGYGTNALSGAGDLMYIKFNVIGDLGTESPLHFTSFVFNAGVPPVELTDGSVIIPPKVCGDADENNEIQAYDAALTLQHAIELIVLPQQGEINADVNEDSDITAFDAAIILRQAIGLPMPQGVTTCFDAKFGFTDALPDKYEFRAKLTNVVSNSNKTIADIVLEGIPEPGKVFAVSFDISSPTANIKSITMPDLPNGYLMFVNPTSSHTYRIAIINSNGVVTNDMKMHIEMTGFNYGTALFVNNILLNDQAMSNIKLSGNSSNEIVVSESLIAYPNPFNASTNITFQVNEDSQVRLEIYDQFGRKMKTLVNEHKEKGFYNVVWFGESDAGSTVKQGWYVVKLQNGNHFEQIKVTLIY